jgi:hypothetical protein
LRIASICGSTVLIESSCTDDDVGPGRLQRLGRVARLPRAEPLGQADDVAEIAADLGRIDVDGTDDFETGRAATCLTIARHRAEPEVHDFDVGHNPRIIAAGVRRRHCPLRSIALPMAHDPPRPHADHVIWAYRLPLDRDPENEDVIGPKLAAGRRPPRSCGIT